MLDQVWVADQLLVDNDGTIRKHELNDGSIALKKGMHKIKLIYINNIVGGWTTDWNEIALKMRNATDSDYKLVADESLFYN